MRNEDRDSARRKLDKELRHYRLAAMQRHCTQDLLRAVRQALGVPVEEIARTLGVNSSVLFELEQSEGRGTISLNSMERVASAIGCKFVYAIVPLAGKTLEEMGDERKWSKRLGVGKAGNREQGAGNLQRIGRGSGRLREDKPNGKLSRTEGGREPS